MKNYIAAFLESAQYVRMHPDEAASLLAQDYAKPFSAEQIRTFLALLTFDPRISKATQQAAQQGFDFAVKIGALPNAPTFSDMFDVTLLNEVAREHPEFLRDLPPIPRSLLL